MPFLVRHALGGGQAEKRLISVVPRLGPVVRDWTPVSVISKSVDDSRAAGQPIEVIPIPT